MDNIFEKLLKIITVFVVALAIAVLSVQISMADETDGNIPPCPEEYKDGLKP